MYEPVPLHDCETAADVRDLARAVAARRRAQRWPPMRLAMRVVLRKPRKPEVVPEPPKWPAPVALVSDIQRLTAEFYGVSSHDFFSHRRPWRVAHCRQVAMYLTKLHTLRSLPEIGRLFRGRDHTTVLHAVNIVTRRRRTDRELDDEVAYLSSIVAGMAS